MKMKEKKHVFLLREGAQNGQTAQFYKPTTTAMSLFFNPTGYLPCPHVRKKYFPHRFPWQRFRNFSIMMNSLQKTHLAVEILKYILRPMWHWFSTKKEETKAEHAHKTCTNPNTKTHRSVFILWDLVSEKCVFVHRKCWIRLDGRPKRTRLVRFHKKISSVRTGP